MISLTIRQIAQAVGGRVIRGDENTAVINVKIDSGECEKGTLFVPLIGERRDAHDFIEAAEKKGAVCAFVSRENVTASENMGLILVEDTRAALQRFGRFYREQMGVGIIGITGSVGKTTTKEMVAAALETGLKITKTKGNWNSQVGLPRMMLEITKDLDRAVIEMGMSMRGEMERLSDIAAPQIAVITNIGVSHIGNLGSREAIRREKLSIIDGFREGGYLLVNGDDERLKADVLRALDSDEAVAKEFITEKTRRALKLATIDTYGIGEDCRFRAVNIDTVDGCSEFDFTDSEDEGQLTHVRLSTPDMAHVFNAVCAMALAKHLGLDLKKASEGLAKYVPGGMRGEIKEIKGVTYINDAYNASPDSMRSGLDLLMKTAAKRHIAVLADMLELGDMSEKCHRDTGSMAAAFGVDILVAIGKESECMADQAGKDSDKTAVHHFMSNDEAYTFLTDILTEGDAILFKGSRGMKLEEIIDRLMNR